MRNGDIGRALRIFMSDIPRDRAFSVYEKNKRAAAEAEKKGLIVISRGKPGTTWRAAMTQLGHEYLEKRAAETAAYTP